MDLNQVEATVCVLKVAIVFHPGKVLNLLLSARTG